MNNIFVLLLIIYLSLGIPDSLLASNWPNISENLNLDISLLSFINVFALFASMLSANYYFVINKYISDLNIIKYSLITSIIATVVFVFFNNIPTLIITQIILGFGGGAIDSSVNKISALKLNEGQLNLLHGFWGIGISLTPLVSGVFYFFGFNFKIIYLFISLILVFVYFIFYKNKQLLTSDLEINQKIEKQKLTLTDWLGPIVCFLYVIEYTFGLFISTFLVEVYKYKIQDAAVVTFIYWFSITLSRICSKFLFNYFDSYILVKNFIKLSLISSIFLLFNINIIIVISVFFIGFGFGPLYPMIMFYATKINSKSNRDYIVSKQVAAIFLAMFLMQIILGFIFSNYNYSVFTLYVILNIFILYIFVSKYMRNYSIFMKTKVQN